MYTTFKCICLKLQLYWSLFKVDTLPYSCAISDHRLLQIHLKRQRLVSSKNFRASFPSLWMSAGTDFCTQKCLVIYNFHFFCSPRLAALTSAVYLASFPTINSRSSRIGEARKRTSVAHFELKALFIVRNLSLQDLELMNWILVT